MKPKCLGLSQILRELGDVHAQRGDRREGGDHVEVEAEAGQRQERRRNRGTSEARRLFAAANGNLNEYLESARPLFCLAPFLSCSG